MNIVNSDFLCSLDDTLINRLAETLFCRSSCHDGKLKLFEGDKDNFCNDVLSHVTENTFSHPNIVQVVVAYFSLDSDMHPFVESILEKCIYSSSYFYNGLWCYGKLLKVIYIKEKILLYLTEQYLVTNNVILSSLLQEILCDNYLLSFQNNTNVLFCNKLEGIIFSDIDRHVLMLKMILEKNFAYCYKLHNIYQQIATLSPSHCGLSSVLIYCQAISGSDRDEFTNSLINFLKNLEENQIKQICKAFLYFINVKLLQASYDNSTLCQFLWQKILTFAMVDKTFHKCLLSLGGMSRKLFPDGVFKIAFNAKYFELLTLIDDLSNEELNLISDYFASHGFTDIECFNTVCLLRTFFINLYNKPFKQSLTNKTVWVMHNSILNFIRCESLTKNDDDENVINLYLTVLNSCIQSDHLSVDYKSMILLPDVNNLISIQYNSLKRYSESESLDLLSIRIVETLVKAIVVCFNSTNFTLDAKTAVIERFVDFLFLIRSISDFHDDFMFENLFYCIIGLGANVVNNIDPFVEFLDRFSYSEPKVSIKIVLCFIPFCLNDLNEPVDNRLVAHIFQSLTACKYKMDGLSTDYVRDQFKRFNIEYLFDRLNFCKEYCPLCKENEYELVEDLYLSAKPLDCYGD